MRTAVVGHVEWATFARVDHVPVAGEIVHGEDVFDVPAGGGAVAAVQLQKLAGECTFYTALADDDLGRRSHDELRRMGVRVECVFRHDTQRRALVHVDGKGERTITVLGPRLGPMGAEPLPWNELGDVDACYFCAGDDEALRLARRAKVLVATSRESERLVRTGVQLDAVVGSGTDPSEVYANVTPQPLLVVTTFGPEGGTYTAADGTTGAFAAAALPGPVVDAYGAGDAFAAGLAYALGANMPTDEALAFAARCGAAALTGRGPYQAQLRID